MKSSRFIKTAIIALLSLCSLVLNPLHSGRAPLPGEVGSFDVGAAERNSALLNVRDFGAKGDGVSDDTAAIQTAINGASRGATVLHSRTGLPTNAPDDQRRARGPGGRHERRIVASASAWRPAIE